MKRTPTGNLSNRRHRDALRGLLLVPLPSIEAQKSGGGVGSVLANYIYDALTGNRVQITPPMDGKIIAKPKLEAFGGYRKYETINGYSHSGLTPDVDVDRKRGYDDKWPEYFDVDYGEVVENPTANQTLNLAGD